jgi:CRISPR/Cas system-associated protein endoribonuclease Cas2
MQQLPDHRNSAGATWLYAFLEFELPTATTTIQRAQNNKREQLVCSCFGMLQSNEHSQLAQKPALKKHGLRLICPLVR